MLEHPEITWAQETGYPSWAQEEGPEDDYDAYCDYLYEAQREHRREQSESGEVDGN
jgi:hypothetical protein